MSDPPRPPGLAGVDAVLRAARGRSRSQMSATELIAGALSLIWVAGLTLIFVFGRSEAAGGFDPLRFVLTLMAVFLPVAVIWVGASAAKSARLMHEESQRLQAAIDAIRHSYLSQQQAASTAQRPALERKLDEIAQAQKKTEAAIATFASIRHPPPAEPPQPAAEPTAAAAEQPLLALGTPSEALTSPPSTPDFLRALNFPETAEDAEGFRALRRALQDRQTAQLIQASQDVLTLLSQDGIYMDDLAPDLTRPEVWRRFAAGERGRAISALGAVHDRSSLALTAGRMRADAIFRDAVHHFLRKFDQMLTGFVTGASDSDLIALSDTRSARAFMLLGRVAGTFD